MSTKVKLKFKERGKRISKEELKSLACNEIGVPFVRLYEIPEGYKALCKNDDEVDKLLNIRAKEVFERNGVVVITPPEIKAKRSFFIRKLQEDVGKHTAEEFKCEIEDKNSWMAVSEVTKIKDFTHVVKVECRETSMVETVLRIGLKIFNTSILPDQIAREEFISLLTCFNCYAYEDHTTFNCPDKNTKHCSECGGTGHKFFECMAIEKNCLNCLRNKERKTDHRTMAMSCPLKKRLIKEKREAKKEAEEEKQNKSYSMIAKKAAQEISGEKIEINLSEITHYKILASILHAHVLNLQKPGCYKKELNEMLKQNGLPEMWFPDNPDSAAVLGSKVTPRSTTEIEQEGTVAMERTESSKEQRQRSRHLPMDVIEERPYMKRDKEGGRDPRLQARKHDRGYTEQEKQVEETEQIQDRAGEEIEIPPRQPRDADELRMTIYITNKQNFPTKDPKRSEIAKGIEKRTHKYTYENKMYAEEYVEYLLKTEKLEITKDDFKLVEEAKFKKIRNGPTRGSPKQTEGHKKIFKHGEY